MKTKLKLFIIVFFVTATAFTAFANNGDNVLARYYSNRLSFNLNHILNLTKGLYQLSGEPRFKKEYLETELIQLDDEIKYSNIDIANMTKYMPEEDIERIQKYLDNIDGHLAQVYVDIKNLRKHLNSNQQVNIPGLISDIYSDIKQAENEDHREIIKLHSYMSNNLLETSKSER